MDSSHTHTPCLQRANSADFLWHSSVLSTEPSVGCACMYVPPLGPAPPTNIFRWSKGGFEESSEGGLLAGRHNPRDSSPVTTLSPPAAAAGPAARQQQAVLPVLQVRQWRATVNMGSCQAVQQEPGRSLERFTHARMTAAAASLIPGVDVGERTDCTAALSAALC